MSHQKAFEALQAQAPSIEKIASFFVETLRAGGKIIFMGNGGSAADSQHLAAELVGRFKKNRRPLASIALSTNTSIITAIGNDFGFEEIFTRQIEALAKASDVVVGISTSGESKNVIGAITKAKELTCKTVGFLGKSGSALERLVDSALLIETGDTPRIQEMHILAGHIICEMVEAQLT
ncbi:MAG: D-sedoheptulose 7-phosphate isomerase [Candidatus Omnitrophota bacterium]